MRGLTSATEAYALAQAEQIRTRYAADWGLAETGAAGPGPHPLGVPSGTSAIGIVGPDGLRGSTLIQTGSDHRLGNMQAFAHAALTLLVDLLWFSDDD